MIHQKSISRVIFKRKQKANSKFITNVFTLQYVFSHIIQTRHFELCLSVIKWAISVMSFNYKEHVVILMKSKR